MTMLTGKHLCGVRGALTKGSEHLLLDSVIACSLPTSGIRLHIVQHELPTGAVDIGGYGISEWVEFRVLLDLDEECGVAHKRARLPHGGGELDSLELRVLLRVATDIRSNCTTFSLVLVTIGSRDSENEARASIPFVQGHDLADCKIVTRIRCT